jgi:hypothetical protein
MIQYHNFITQFNIYLKNVLTTTTYQNIHVNINYILQLVDAILAHKKNRMDSSVQLLLTNLLSNGNYKNNELSRNIQFIETELVNLNRPLLSNNYQGQSVKTEPSLKINESKSFKSYNWLILLIVMQLWTVAELSTKNHFQLNKKQIYTLLKSPHTDKKARMQFAKIKKKSTFTKLDRVLVQLIKPLVISMPGGQHKTILHTIY